ncbi:SH3 domain-containing protein Dlish-like [Limulus polyphemus]|uniref:SH3 domain-containing protein Dlish-like n=1 Tax=Limulus polyphemus TaxID=6850 RepID=A0ABM1T0P0_LIMPO|nr:SH3 domain-containing protein Dlish-like [Limulus polyphemus]XP_022249443.1 SH3 domain-containing protein Dlish-like [Limulus polyphemus]XP_022249445.1 SH3 domain-containing protein Dlish-like [Limulus polyphemus]XP_022249446.1 SH3 domain-containing protein Dlish-like [Limulus polyphemus]
MAFLCPLRIRRGKRKKEGDKLPSRTPSIGRITGSASIETLVRVGIEKENGLSPESKMVVLHDFTPCVDDELEVRRGQVVNVLYQENDWVYVIAENSQEGFIPHSYCAPQPAELALNLNHKKLPRHETEIDQNSLRGTLYGESGGQHSDAESFSGNHQIKKDVSSLGLQKSQSSSQVSLPDVHPFFKDPAGRYIVLYTFIARDENDVSVECGEFVTVLNREDPDWFWIVRSDGQEGFVPSAFVYPADAIQGHVGQQVVNPADQTHLPQSMNNNNHHQSSGVSEDLRFHGSELVMLYDYKAQAPDDLSVRRGDWIYADLNNQTVDGWLWAYAPKTRKYGFIPKAYARPPAMTSL